MHPNFLLKSVLHGVACLLTGGFALLTFDNDVSLAVFLMAASIAMLLLVFFHDRVLKNTETRTSIFFVFESLALAVIAWKLYDQGHHKATFLFEGISVVFLSLAAFSFMLRKKRDVLFIEEE
jgi:hypothetical protein